ncbi:hypothetical protein SNEBB_009368 [Seison nebaliae]|nr:hypothetical protein SNEBB_009368 [Seison nebaliae]
MMKRNHFLILIYFSIYFSYSSAEGNNRCLMNFNLQKLNGKCNKYSFIDQLPEKTIFERLSMFSPANILYLLLSNRRNYPLNFHLYRKIIIQLYKVKAISPSNQNRLDRLKNLQFDYRKYLSNWREEYKQTTSPSTSTTTSNIHDSTTIDFYPISTDYLINLYEDGRQTSYERITPITNSLYQQENTIRRYGTTTKIPSYRHRQRYRLYHRYKKKHNLYEKRYDELQDHLYSWRNMKTSDYNRRVLKRSEEIVELKNEINFKSRKFQKELLDLQNVIEYSHSHNWKIEKVRKVTQLYNNYVDLYDLSKEFRDKKFNELTEIRATYQRQDDKEFRKLSEDIVKYRNRLMNDLKHWWNLQLHR